MRRQTRQRPLDDAVTRQRLHQFGNRLAADRRRFDHNQQSIECVEALHPVATGKRAGPFAGQLGIGFLQRVDHRRLPDPGFLQPAAAGRDDLFQRSRRTTVDNDPGSGRPPAQPIIRRQRKGQFLRQRLSLIGDDFQPAHIAVEDTAQCGVQRFDNRTQR